MTDGTAARLVYVTVGSMDEAKMLARSLVSERLAACANIFDGVRSVYRWEGEVTEDGEVIVILKTREELVGKLTDRVKALHSYECPCVVSFAIDGGHPDFLQWIFDETASA